MGYYIRKQYIDRSTILDSLSRESGRLYSETIKFFWRTVRKKNIWLSYFALTRLFYSHKMHAHSADASVEAFFHALKSWKQKRKNDPNSKPPKKLRYYRPVIWKKLAIKIKNNSLSLSNGRHQKPVVVNNWQYPLPVQVMLRWTGSQYELIFIFSQQVSDFKDTNIAVGVDIGQIHVAACSDGTILNGRLLRSIKQWRHKKLADYQNKMNRKKKRSKRWYKLRKAKQKFLKKIENKSKDILHKFTTGLVATQKNKGVSTLVVGDLSGFRLDNDKGTERNQENHQWLYSKISWYLKYKAEQAGMKFISQEESYTSKTCPQCGHRKKPTGREYNCLECGFLGHRDIVGATNILRKYLGTFGLPVVAGMASAAGIRYKPDIRVAQGFCLRSRNVSFQKETKR